MQRCSLAQATQRLPTAAQCRDYAQSIGGAQRVTQQLNAGFISESSTGACILNSGGGGQWELLSASALGAICDTANPLLGGCACVATDEYITIDGTSLSGGSPLRLGFDTVNYPGQDTHGLAYTAALCCQLCANTHGPSAPPSPPLGPSPPNAPPIPPGTPPPPPFPGYPPGTLLAEAALASTGVSIGTDCEGIVITDDGYCHLFNRNLITTHSDATSGCTSTGCSNVKGRYVYTMPSPPPPPHAPHFTICRSFTHYHDERLGAPYALETSTVTVADVDSKLHATQTRARAARPDAHSPFCALPQAPSSAAPSARSSSPTSAPASPSCAPPRRAPSTARAT